MRPARLLLASLLVLGFLSAAAAEDRRDEPSPTDGDGNPLPRGAIARLGSTRWRLPHEPRNIILSPDGRTLAVTTNDHTTEIVDAKTGRRLQNLSAPAIGEFGPRVPVAFSVDGKRIAYLDTAKALQVLKIRNLGSAQELCIDFRAKDHYEPKLKQQGQSQRRGEYITALRFSANGQILAAAVHFHITIYGENERILWDENENVLRRWEVSSGKELPPCSGHARTISSIFFSADGKTLTTAGEDGTVRFWDAATTKEKRPRWTADGPLFCAAYSPDGKWFAAGSKQAVLLWEVQRGVVRHQLAMPAEETRSLAFTTDSKLLAAGGGTVLRVWEMGTAKRVRETPPLPHPITALAFSADGKLLFLGHEDEQIVRRLEAATLKPVGELNGHTRTVSCFAFTADNQRLLTAASEDDFRFWDARTGKPCPSSVIDKKLCERAWLASFGQSLPLLSEPGEFRTVTTTIIWKTSTGEEISGSDPAWSADGKRLLIAQEKDKHSTLIVLDMESNKKLRELPKKDENTSAALSPDGRTLAVAASERLTFLDVDSGQAREYVFATWKSGAVYSLHLTYSPDSSRVAFLGRDGKVLIVSARDGRLIGAIPSEHPRRLVGLTFSADAKTFCISAFGEPQTLWEIATGQRIHSCPGRSCLFSPNNRLLLVSKDEALHLYDLHSGKLLRSYKDTEGFTGNFTFSPDDKRLATASKDTTILLWDTASPEAVENTTALDEKTLDRLWKDLKTEKAAAAYPAMGRLIADPHHTLRFLRKRLRQVAPVEEKRLRQWIAELDSDSFDKREAASRELVQIGSVAESALRKALTGPTSPEMRRRIKELLRPFEAKETRFSAEELAHLRAIQVLESIGTSEARQLLKHLAEGAEGVTRTRDAQEAIQRMRAHSK